MARRKKQLTPAMRLALTRHAGLVSIDPALDLGSGQTVTGYKAVMDITQQKLDAYNSLLSEADAALDVFQQAEKGLKESSARMLEGVAVKFGRDSVEYEQAGGTRLSERKRPVRNEPAVPPGG